MKKTFIKTFSLIICTLMTLCVMLTGCSGNPANSDSGSGSPDKPKPTVHVCESKCPVCGLCLDTECTEAVCLQKCGGTHENSTEFKITDLNVAKTSLVYDTTEKYYKGFTKTNEGAVSYKIYAKAEATVTLIVKVMKSMDEEVFTDAIETTLNNEKLSRASVIPSALDGSIAAVNLGCIKLREKENTLTFVAKNDSEHEFSSIVLTYADEETKYTLKQAEQVEHTCREKCEGCDGCTDFSCVNTGCAKKCKCQSGTYNATIFSVLDSRTYKSRAINGEKDGVGCTWNQTTTIRFKIYSDAARTVKFGTMISSSPNNRNFTDQFDMTVNGTKISCDGGLCPFSEGYAWNSYSLVVVGDIQLAEGSNTIEFKQKPVKGTTGAHNFQSLLFFSDEGTFKQEELHNMQAKEAGPATCASVGFKENCYYCTMCQTYFDDENAQTETNPDNILPIDPHNHEVELALKEKIDATCNAVGFANDCYYCSKCKKYFNDQAGTQEADASNQLAKDPHNHATELTLIEKKAATCSAIGFVNDCYYCSKCKKYFDDQAGTQETDASNQIAKDPGNHVNTTTNEDGTVTCNDCKKTIG